MADFLTLNTGQSIPSIGLGTWQLKDDQLKEALRTALDAGYRHIDTAYSYGNEAEIGEVLQEYLTEGKVKREELFVTTKLWMTHLAKDDVRKNFEESLRHLKLDYVDLYLIHFPVGFKNRGDGTLFPMDSSGKIENEEYNLSETWQAMEALVDEGKIRSLGVSNFNSLQVDRICQMARYKPVTNQVECHAYLPQEELKKYCEQRGVLLTAFAPLASPGRPAHMATEGEPVLLLEVVLETIGNKYNKTPAQVLLRHLRQRGIISVPKSSSPSRIRQNIQIFDFKLSDEDMAAIDKLRNDHRFFSFVALGKGCPEYPFDIPF